MLISVNNGWNQNMKKIFLVLFVLLSSFLFFSLAAVKAQTSTPINQTFQIPGITCGDAEAKKDDVKKCCLSSNLSLKDRVDVPDIFCISDLIGSPIKGGCIGNVFDGIKNYFFSIWPVKDLEEKWLSGEAYKVNPCINGNPSTTDYSNPSCVCQIQPATTKILCDRYLINSKDYNSCVTCSEKGVWTSIGCINNDLNSFIEENIFGLGISLAGGFSLLCIIYAAFMMQSSEGNPEKLKKAQEMITSCITGLILIIFSIFILKLIGVNILKIPGFS